MSTTFGTDGIRGVANSQLRPEIALALGRAAARHLGETAFLVGRDTRQSGPMLLAAFCAGVTAEGFDVIDVGVIPTPGLAWLGAKHRLPVAMISASHNPFGDNGIKLFGPGGSKLSSDEERVIEQDLNALLKGEEVSLLPVPTGRGVGTIISDSGQVSDYIDDLENSVNLDGTRRLHVVVDCANGAASALAPQLFSRFNLKLSFIANTPDGTNINDHCGATSPHLLAQTVVREHADLGISFDGVADRLIACDGEGVLVNGDVLLALFAFDLDLRNLLEKRTVAVTVMSNLGLRRALTERGIEVVETAVGDRNVTDAMEEHSIVLGGEQSGHVVFRRQTLIGDGLLSGLKLIELCAHSKQTLSELAKGAMTAIPQVIRNVVVDDLRLLDNHPQIFIVAKEIEESLGEWGRVFIRASGTEPKIRIMVEAEDEAKVRSVVEELVRLVERAMAIT